MVVAHWYENRGFMGGNQNASSPADGCRVDRAIQDAFDMTVPGDLSRRLALEAPVEPTMGQAA
jgi:hypothetical protein